MSYLQCLQQFRWVRCWSDRRGSYYRMRLGNSGRNGCEVPSLSSKEEKAIAEWFGKHGITRGATDTSLWWSMTPFSHHFTLRSEEETATAHALKVAANEEITAKLRKEHAEELKSLEVSHQEAEMLAVQAAGAAAAADTIYEGGIEFQIGAAAHTRLFSTIS